MNEHANKDLAQAYDNGAKQHAGQTIEAPGGPYVLRGSQPATEGRLTRWRTEGLRLLGDLQRRLHDARQAYSTGRAVIVAEAERKRDELQVEFGEKLRAFDREQQARIDKLQAELSELFDYREVGSWD